MKFEEAIDKLYQQKPKMAFGVFKDKELDAWGFILYLERDQRIPALLASLSAIAQLQNDIMAMSEVKSLD